MGTARYHANLNARASWVGWLGWDVGTVFCLGSNLLTCTECREIMRDYTNAVPPHLRRDVFRSRRYGLHAWRFLFQFGRALMRIIREHSLGSRCSGNPTDVRPRDASLVVSQALWICSLQVGRPRSTADLAARMNISRHQFDSNSIPPDHWNGPLQLICRVGHIG